MAQTNDFLTYVTAYYVTYLALCTILIFWVAQTLHRSGSVFLNDAFHGDASLIRSVTHLLDVGFYLICVGYVLLTGPQLHLAPESGPGLPERNLQNGLLSLAPGCHSPVQLAAAGHLQASWAFWCAH